MALIELSPILILSAAEEGEEKKTSPREASRTIVRSFANHCLKGSELASTLSINATTFLDFGNRDNTMKRTPALRAFSSEMKRIMGFLSFNM
jgi:hypothetical protein